MFTVQLRVTVETTGWGMVEELTAAMDAKGYWHEFEHTKAGITGPLNPAVDAADDESKPAEL